MDESARRVNRKVAAGPGAATRPGLPLVAIVGRANVGKSTLFNRLARARRALVEDRPGVTRDRVAAEASIEGREVLLVDTGGLDPEADEGLPAAVAAQVRRAVEEASVLLFVVDVHAGLLPLDRTIAGLLRRAGAQVILVANKCDGPKRELDLGEFHALGFSELIPVSAEHRRGLADLEIAIAERLPPAPEPSELLEDSAARVAIVGRPNVGKSSLLNRLVGEGVVVVSDRPGTTRDATDHRLALGDDEVVLIDTAGLRRPGRRADRLERGSAFMALRSIEQADVAVLLLDSTEGVTEQDAKIARIALDRGRPLVIALNKWDAVDPATRPRELRRELERRLRFVADPVLLRISAKTGRGTGRVLPAALELWRESRLEVPTPELNRALRDAVTALQPPMGGRRRTRLYYATQISSRPFTALVFVSNPDYVPENYRRYLESFFRKRFGIRSAPVRVRLRRRRSDEDEGEAEGRG